LKVVTRQAAHPERVDSTSTGHCKRALDGQATFFIGLKVSIKSQVGQREELRKNGMDRKKDFGKKLVVQAWGPLGKSWERSLRLRMPVKLHRISGPHVQVRSHKPEGRQFKSDRRNKRSCICGPFQEICKEGRAGASQQTSSWRLGYPCSSAAERLSTYRLSSE
jgi:hypothetical protein